MTTLIAGDTHCRIDMLYRIAAKADENDADSIVLLGDIMDEWNATTEDRCHMAEHLAAWMEEQTSKREVSLLLGNHDLPYLLDEQWIRHQAPGFDEEAWEGVHEIYETLPWQVAVVVPRSHGLEPLVCTHGGIMESWLRGSLQSEAVSPSAIVDDINRLIPLHQWHTLYSWGQGGANRFISPLWARPENLMSGAAVGLHQVVGHTPVRTVTLSATKDSSVLYADTMTLAMDGSAVGDGSLLLVGGHGSSPLMEDVEVIL